MLPTRIASKIAIGAPDECWLWLASTRGGYGQVSVGGRLNRSVRQAHRVVYELMVGPVAPELALDHLCRNKLCCNPDHLEPVTWRENVLRGEGHTAVNARKTHCASGGEFVRYLSSGQRKCADRCCPTCTAAGRRAA